MLKIFKSRSKVTVKIKGSKFMVHVPEFVPSERPHLTYMKALFLRIKKLWPMFFKVFQKWVKGHVQGHMFQIYGTVRKTLSQGTHNDTCQTWMPYLLEYKSYG